MYWQKHSMAKNVWVAYEDPNPSTRKLLYSVGVKHVLGDAEDGSQDREVFVLTDSRPGPDGKYRELGRFETAEEAMAVVGA